MVVLSTGVVNLGQQAKRLSSQKQRISWYIRLYTYIYTVYIYICQSNRLWFLAREYVGDCASMGLFSCFCWAATLRRHGRYLECLQANSMTGWTRRPSELQHESLDETVEGRRWWQAEFAWIYSLIWLVCVWLVSRSRQSKLQFWDIYFYRPAIADFHG